MLRAFIISPTYNARRYIKASVLSVVDNLPGYPDLHHIVVDDQSNDGTWERLQQDDLSFPHLTLIRNEERLASAVGSFMAGIEYVREHFDPGPEDVVFWLDGDDWLCQDRAIKKMMRPYSRNPNVEMCYSNHVAWGGGIKTHGGYSHELPPRPLRRYLRVAYSHLRSFRWKMLEVLNHDRLLDPKDGKPWKFAGDSALFLPMLEVAKRVKYIKEPLYVYNEERADNEIKKDATEQHRCSVAIRSQVPNTNTRPEVYPRWEFAPTRRFKLDHGRVCNIQCRGCYYLHQKPWRNKTLAEIEQQIIAGAQRGNRMCDISGGEPTIAKDLPRWLELCGRYGLFPGIITHGQDLAGTRLERLWDAGLHDILFSIHGSRDAHNAWTQTEKRGGYDRLFDAFLQCYEAGFRFRTNTVLSDSYKTLPEMAGDLTVVRPYISNFINFNPYSEWAAEDKPFMARVSDIAPYLKEAIDISTANGTMVNVRYFPFCVLKGYEKHIVNMHQVMFDPYEWDYGVMPKTVDRYAAHGEELSDRTALFAHKCLECAIAGSVCNGVNKVYLMEFGDEELEPYEGEAINDPQHFRRTADAGQLYTYVGHNYEWMLRRKGGAETGSGGPP